MLPKKSITPRSHGWRSVVAVLIISVGGVWCDVVCYDPNPVCSFTTTVMKKTDLYYGTPWSFAQAFARLDVIVSRQVVMVTPDFVVVRDGAAYHATVTQRLCTYTYIYIYSGCYGTGSQVDISQRQTCVRACCNYLWKENCLEMKGKKDRTLYCRISNKTLGGLTHDVILNARGTMVRSYEPMIMIGFWTRLAI
jgi:hypothetical protein